MHFTNWIPGLLLITLSTMMSQSRAASWKYDVSRIHYFKLVIISLKSKCKKMLILIIYFNEPSISKILPWLDLCGCLEPYSGFLTKLCTVSLSHPNPDAIIWPEIEVSWTYGRCLPASTKCIWGALQVFTWFLLVANTTSVPCPFQHSSPRRCLRVHSGQ